MVEPEAKQKVMQGVTTEVLGQDGLGEAPLRDDVVGDWRRYLSGLNGDPDVDWSWRSFAEYLERIEEARPATNVASLVGHGNLRLLAVGVENREPTTHELDVMKKLLIEGMRDGAYGLSSGLIYPPCVYAKTSELVELCRVAAVYGGIFAVHMRNEGDRLFDSINEVLAVGREASIPVHISHFKSSGERNWGKATEALAMLGEARLCGLDVTVDQYPYVAGSTFLSSLLPAWAHEGGTAKMLERLREPATRLKIASEMSETDRVSEERWDKVLITSLKSEANRWLEGKTLTEIAEVRGERVFDIIFDLVLEEENAVAMVSFTMCEDDVSEIMASPFQMVCTDGIVLGKPHPRAYGAFARVLGRYVRGGIVRLEEAVRKMTSLPSQRFGLLDRGLLRPGMSADITIFDPEKVSDRATYENPVQFPTGVEYVIVNGEVTVENCEHTGVRNGRVLRHLVVEGG